jgi:glycosyltransferase involved in cell wall biosynthesis
MTVPAPMTTVIVPNYNHAAALGHCIDAVRRQTYPRIELIVVDDRSTDESVAVAEAHGVTVVRTAVNGGPSVARNLGARLAHGEFLFFVDSDGALAPDAVANAVSMLQADPGLGAVCGIEDADPLIVDSRVEEYRCLQHHYWSIVSQGEVSFLFSAMFAMRASVFAEIGPFDERLRQTEEVDYGNRLSRRYRLRSTALIHGKLDHDDKLFPLLRKLFHRGRLRVPMYARQRRFAKGYETPSRAVGALAALAGVVMLPLAVLAGPVALAVPAALLVASQCCDARMFGYVARRRGALFACYFAALHIVVKVVIGAAAVAGAAQWLASRRFRATYAARPAADLAETPR